MAAAPRPTSDRLLAAATDLFAHRGFHGTSIRDIADRASANVASGHYHYGSKEGLYLEVLRAQFARVRGLLAHRGLQLAETKSRGTSRRELRALLEARVCAILDLLLGPPPGPHGALMLREMCDPTMAMPIIVAEFIRPLADEMEALLARLAPRAPREAIRLAAFSVFGQILFYRFNMPALLLLLRQPRYPRGFSHRIARHITRFSLAGLTAVGSGRSRRAS
jgi:TetR/AcrR family transcriptional regulator, regulator of cefoperazone and chloramphenicol sensitivity